MPYYWWNFRVNNWFTKACDCGAQTRIQTPSVVETVLFPVLFRSIYRK